MLECVGDAHEHSLTWIDDVDDVDVDAEKMRRWTPEKAKKLGLVTSRESIYYTKRRLEEGGQKDDPSVGFFEKWFGTNLEEDSGAAGQHTQEDRPA